MTQQTDTKGQPKFSTKSKKPTFKTPTAHIKCLERSSTTVLGNCTWWKEVRTPW